MRHSTDYHDYVIKDGRFIGKFNEMYQYSREIPWHQDKAANYVFSNVDIAILKQFNYDSVCDIGCGIGYFSSRLHKELKAKAADKKPKITGIDISETAVKKAREKFGGIRFVVGDLLKERPLGGEYFDLVIAKEIIWYVCHNLKHFLQNAVSMLNQGGLLYISQSFPEAKIWWGQNIIDSPETLKNIIYQYVAPVYYCVERDYNLRGRPLVHILGKKKGVGN